MASSAPSARCQTALKHVEAWNSLSLEGLMSLRADEIAGSSKQDNTVYRQSLASNPLRIFKTFEMQVDQIIEDEANNSLVMTSQGKATTDFGTFETEYVFVMHFNKEGTKFVKFLEYVGSARMNMFLDNMKAAMAAAEATKAQ